MGYPAGARSKPKRRGLIKSTLARIAHNDGKRVWIAEVGVYVSEGCTTLSPGAKGAYVSTLAYAETETEFRTLAEGALASLGLIPFEFTDIEPFELRRLNYNMSTEIMDLAEEVQISKEVRFGIFHTYNNVE